MVGCGDTTRATCRPPDRDRRRLFCKVTTSSSCVANHLLHVILISSVLAIVDVIGGDQQMLST
jgi:hypothetical protein